MSTSKFIIKKKKVANLLDKEIPLLSSLFLNPDLTEIDKTFKVDRIAKPLLKLIRHNQIMTMKKF